MSDESSTTILRGLSWDKTAVKARDLAFPGLLFSPFRWTDAEPYPASLDK